MGQDGEQSRQVHGVPLLTWSPQPHPDTSPTLSSPMLNMSLRLLCHKGLKQQVSSCCCMSCAKNKHAAWDQVLARCICFADLGMMPCTAANDMNRLCVFYCEECLQLVLPFLTYDPLPSPPYSAHGPSSIWLALSPHVTTNMHPLPPTPSHGRTTNSILPPTPE